jgi:hypothetical protein
VALWLVGCHQKGGMGHHSLFKKTLNHGRSVEEWGCQKVGDYHVRRIQLSYCQQHMVLGATSQG